MSTGPTFAYDLQRGGDVFAMYQCLADGRDVPWSLDLPKSWVRNLDHSSVAAIGKQAICNCRQQNDAIATGPHSIPIQTPRSSGTSN